MNINQLRVFKALVELGKVSDVAKMLHIKQPTVSFHINKLQEEIGVNLFKTKTLHNVRLSDPGKTLYQYAKNITSTINEAERVMIDYKANRKGALNIGATHTAAKYLIVPKISEIKDILNSVSIQLEVNRSPSIIAQIKNFELDLGIISQVDFEDDDLHIQKVMEDTLVVTFSKQHPFALIDQLKVEDFEQYPMVQHEQGSTSRRLIDEWAFENDVNLDVTFETSNSEVLKEAVKRNLGYAFLSETLAKQSAKEGYINFKYVPNLNINRAIYIVWHKDKWLSNSLIQIIELIQNKNIGRI